MEQSQNTFELPQDFEKLSHKFILDALREQRLEEKTPPPSEPVVEEPTPVSTPYRPLALEPGKKYFRIGEVAELVGVEPYVLRYWESEFPTIRPVKAGSGHRVYRRKEVQTLHFIRHLLHIEKYSLKGARQRLEARRAQEESPEAEQGRKQNRETLKRVAQQLRELIQVARANPGTF